MYTNTTQTEYDKSFTTSRLFNHRLFILSAGNVASDNLQVNYIDRCDLEPVHDIAQSGNIPNNYRLVAKAPPTTGRFLACIKRLLIVCCIILPTGSFFPRHCQLGCFFHHRVAYTVVQPTMRNKAGWRRALTKQHPHYIPHRAETECRDRTKGAPSYQRWQKNLYGLVSSDCSCR